MSNPATRSTVGEMSFDSQQLQLTSLYRKALILGASVETEN